MSITLARSGYAGIAAVVIASVVTAAGWSSGRSQTSERIDPVSALRQYAAVGLDKLAVDETRDLTHILAERSVVASLIDPFPYTEQAVDALANRLNESQSRWRQGESAGVTAVMLADRLTRELELASKAEYLAIRPAHVNRARIRVWSYVPELRAKDADARTARDGRFFADQLSPVEAYMVADMVIHRKLTDPAFGKTEAEEQSLPFPPLVSRKPGIYVVDLDPRLEEFREQVRSVASAKWPTAEAALSLVPVLLEADHAR
jgi:hypothetical protein